jgi:hypothetical protein
VVRDRWDAAYGWACWVRAVHVYIIGIRFSYVNSRHKGL